MFMWYYDSPIGRFKITRNPCPGEPPYDLQINGIVYGSYETPAAAADDVFCSATGYVPWDEIGAFSDPPTDIYEWNQG